MKTILMPLMLIALSVSLFAGSGQEPLEEAKGPVYKAVSSDAASDLIRDPEVFILDVRTEEEYAAGHIENAYLLPVQDLASRISEIAEYREAEVLVYCRSGNRSSTASRILMDAGFTNVKNLQYGLIEWAGQGLPITVD